MYIKECTSYILLKGTHQTCKIYTQIFGVKRLYKTYDILESFPRITILQRVRKLKDRKTVQTNNICVMYIIYIYNMSNEWREFVHSILYTVPKI